ncbi:MAG: hypothetical protein ACXVLQ_14785 [Bacteriovorax sp.]
MKRPYINSCLLGPLNLSSALLNLSNVSLKNALFRDCENDIETFKDVLISHLRAVSKTELSRATGLGRRTLYDLMDDKKFDPRLSTLSALLSKIAA